MLSVGSHRGGGGGGGGGGVWSVPLDRCVSPKRASLINVLIREVS